jgi:hypothetical protein
LNSKKGRKARAGFGNLVGDLVAALPAAPPGVAPARRVLCTLPQHMGAGSLVSRGYGGFFNRDQRAETARYNHYRSAAKLKLSTGQP